MDSGSMVFHAPAAPLPHSLRFSYLSELIEPLHNTFSFTRYRPMAASKIRYTSSLSDPNSLGLEGAYLTIGISYQSDWNCIAILVKIMA